MIEIPKGALQPNEGVRKIGLKWIEYAKDGDTNDIAVAIWCAIREALDMKEKK